MNEWKCRPGVVLTNICDVHLLVADREAMKECAYVRQVNEIGAFIWERLTEGKCVRDILDLLRAEYDIPADCSLEEDVISFLGTLAEGKYIVETTDSCELSPWTAHGGAK